MVCVVNVSTAFWLLLIPSVWPKHCNPVVVNQMCICSLYGICALVNQSWMLIVRILYALWLLYACMLVIHCWLCNLSHSEGMCVCICYRRCFSACCGTCLRSTSSSTSTQTKSFIQRLFSLEASLTRVLLREYWSLLLLCRRYVWYITGKKTISF